MAAPMGNICRQFSTFCCRNITAFSSFKSQINIQNRARCHTGRPYAGASAGIDIGFPIVPTPKRRGQLAETRRKKSDPDLERAARHRKLQIPLDDVKLVWESTSGAFHIRRVAQHYGIYRDLFDCSTFLPQTMMRIGYRNRAEEEKKEGEYTTPVYSGNFLTPTEVSRPPAVIYDCPDDTLWTLLLTNPDGHLLDNGKEYVHWLIGNIPGNRLSQGDEVFDYLAPFPARGTGYQRLVFVLFKQDGRVDYNNETVHLPCHSLKERTFETLEFYRQYQDVITPSGLAFFQCRWDASVTETFHSTLDMREPVFEYDHPEQFIALQKKFPHRKPLQYLFKFMPSDKRDKVKGFKAKFPNERREDWELRNKYRPN